MRGYILLQDDFSGFGIGEFPFDKDHSATGEYHYVVEQGNHGAWKDQVCNYTYNGMGPSWIITEDQGRYYMESCRIEKGKPHRMFPTLQTGIVEWENYDVSVKLRRLSTKGMAGLAFCMNDSIETLVFALEDKERATLSYRHKEDVLVLKEVLYQSECDEFHEMKVSVDDGCVRCYVDAALVMEVGACGEDPVGRQLDGDQTSGEQETVLAKLLKRGGKIALTADCPTQFTDVCVCTDDETARRIEEKVKAKEAREQTLQASYPGMKVWKKLNHILMRCFMHGIPEHEEHKVYARHYSVI